MLNVVMLSAAMLNVIMLNVVMLSVIMVSVAMLNVIMLSVVILNAIMLNVIALFQVLHCGIGTWPYPQTLDKAGEVCLPRTNTQAFVSYGHKKFYNIG